MQNDDAEALEDAIAAKPATDLRNLAIKGLVNSSEGCFGLNDALTLECAAIAESDFAKLLRCYPKRADSG